MFINGQVIWRFPPKKEGKDALSKREAESLYAYPSSKDSEEVGQTLRWKNSKGQKEEKMISETIKSYAAGLIDGEGCIAIRRKSNPLNSRDYYNLKVCVGLTGNSTALEILKSNWGGQICLGGRSKRQNQWSIYCNQAEKMLIDIMPYLIIKKSQAEIALEFHNNRIKSSAEYGKYYSELLSKFKEISYGNQTAARS